MTVWIVPGLVLIVAATLALAATAGAIRRAVRAVADEVAELDGLAGEARALVSDLRTLAAERAGRSPDAR